MAVSIRSDLCLNTPELGFQGHVRNCFENTPERTEEEALASIETVGLHYGMGGEGPVNTITIDRSPEGHFECPHCYFRETEADNMQVSP